MKLHEAPTARTLRSGLLALLTRSKDATNGAPGIATNGARSYERGSKGALVTKGSPLGDTLSLSCEASVGTSGSNN